MTNSFGYRSAEAQAYRYLYNSAAWKGPSGRRLTQLAKEPLCRMCKAAGRITAATVADHIIPHRGDERLFYEGELQSLCDAAPWRCHSSRKQKIEALGYEPGSDNKGRPVDTAHPWNRPNQRPAFSIPFRVEPSAIPVMLVCGPPGAGKTTWVSFQPF